MRRWNFTAFKFILLLMLPYAATILLPLAAMICLTGRVTTDYRKKIVRERQESMRERQESIESAFERFDGRMDSVITLSHMIADNAVVTRYLYASLLGERHRTIDVIDTTKELETFQINSDVATFYIYDSRSGRIITPVSSYGSAADYFRYAYQVEEAPGRAGTEWLEALPVGYEFSPSMKAKVYGKSTEIIEYRLVLPFVGVRENRSCLVMALEVQDILSDIYDVLGETDEFRLYDRKGNLIYRSGEKYGEISFDQVSDLRLLNTEEEGIYGMALVSNDGLWRMEVCLNDSADGTGLDVTSGYALLLMGLAMVSGIGFSIFFTFRNHREIQEILVMFGGGQQQKKRGGGQQKKRIGNMTWTGYGLIRERAEDVLAENRKYREDMLKLEQSHKYEVLDKLIRNTYTQEAGRDFFPGSLAGKCAVLCIRYRDASYRAYVYGEITLKDVVKDFLHRNAERECEIFDTSSRETICVFSVNEENLNSVAEDMISRLNVEIAYHYKVELEAGVGNVVDSISQIRESYRQAKAVLRYRESTGKNIHFYSELLILEDVYFYPREYDEKISDYIATGQVEQADALVSKIYRENFDENEGALTASASAAVLEKLKGLLILLCGKYGISMEQELAALEEKRDAADYFAEVHRILNLIAGEVAGKKRDAQQNVAMRVMQYINENFCDKDISMDMISQALGYHKVYISSLFSARYKEPVSVAIEKRRIGKACRLLRGSDQTINDIADEVGYLYPASFRRAFKKIMGVSPGEYRDGAEEERT